MSSASPSPVLAPEPPWRAGLHSVRALLYPGLLLQAGALLLVLTYYFVPSAAGAFARIAEWQARGGTAFSSAMTALCGGLLPFVFLRLHADTRAAHPWRHLWFFVFFWAWKGAEVDLWYRVLAHLYGHDNETGTIVAKIVTDQFVFNTLYATPIANVIFAWKDAGWRWGPFRADFRAGQWYYRRCLPVLLAVWFLWIPVTACVYALPSPLQMPLFNVVLCFWAMLYAHITMRQNRDARRL